MGFSLGDVGKAALGPVGILAGDVLGGGGQPSYDTMGAALDEKTRGAIDKQSEMALQNTSQDYANFALDKTDQARGLLNNPDQQERKQTAMGGPNDPGLREALNNKANKAFEGDYNRLQRSEALKGKATEMNRLAQAQDMKSMQNQIQMKLGQRQITDQLNKSAARSAAISSILGVAGTVGGMMMGMPPMPGAVPGGGGAGGAGAGGAAGGANAGRSMMSPGI